MTSLAPTAFQGLSFKAPTGWKKGTPDQHSVEWAAPRDAAKVAVSVFPVGQASVASGCMKKMLDALGPGGFEAMTLGAQPAARKITSDFIGRRRKRPRWRRTRHHHHADRLQRADEVGHDLEREDPEAARFGPMLKRIIESISYGKTP